ncbi:MAG: ParB N-terminal domain-containing protein [Alphaproteobacteria bacterium]
MMAEPDLDALAADIRAYGQRDPIVVHNGLILDGRNRFEACRRAGLAPATVPWDGAGTVEAFVVSRNLHRRHLTASQRTLIAAQLATRKVGNPDLRNPIGSIDPIDPAVKDTALQEAADLLAVSRSSVQRAKRVLNSASPDQIEAIRTTSLWRAIGRRRVG